MGFQLDQVWTGCRPPTWGGTTSELKHFRTGSTREGFSEAEPGSELKCVSEVKFTRYVEEKHLHHSRHHHHRVREEDQSAYLSCFLLGEECI